jgi:hypothetical protein
VFIYSIYGVNEHKKGQFEPARVRKLNEKQFTIGRWPVTAPAPYRMQIPIKNKNKFYCLF